MGSAVSNIVPVVVPVPTPQWTLRTSGLTNAASIAASATAFIVLNINSSQPQKIWRSTDAGSTWASVNTSIALSVTLDDIAYGGGVFIVGAGSNKIARSADDGLTWTSPATPFSANGNGIVGVAYQAGTWLLLANNAAAPAANLYAVSTDGGLTWSQPATFTVDTFDLNAVISDGAQFITLCTIAGVEVFATSPDGHTWTARTAPPNILPSARIAFGAGVYLSGNASSNTVRMASTVAGLAGAADTPMPFADAGISGVAYANGHFLVAGKLGGLAVSADNGVTWVLNALNFPGTTRARWFTFGGGRYIAIGSSGGVGVASTLP